MYSTKPDENGHKLRPASIFADTNCVEKTHSAPKSSMEMVTTQQLFSLISTRSAKKFLIDQEILVMKVNRTEERTLEHRPSQTP